MTRPLPKLGDSIIDLPAGMTTAHAKGAILVARKPSPILSPEAAFAFALCTQQGVARMSHQPSFDYSRQVPNCPRTRKGRTLNSHRRSRLPVHPNL